MADGVSLINIYRTLAELAGIEAPDYVDGFSLVPQLKDSEKAVSAPAICTWGRGCHSVRTWDWRYIRYYDGTEELYSHVNDPDEWTNQPDNPEFAEIKKKLAAHLPDEDVPLIEKGMEKGSLPVSADNPLVDGKATIPGPYLPTESTKISAISVYKFLRDPSALRGSSPSYETFGLSHFPWVHWNIHTAFPV